ncbi:MAG: GntR family transcriptional regulator [Anaerolineaceae bacterium]|nr:GntR family transcriptional regulator [Anaerolineaceae bacterium]
MTVFKEITAEIRQKIMNGTLKVGDSLPSVRGMADRWGCAPGTVQRAYRELAVQGLITTKVGQGTCVASTAVAHTTIRHATLVNHVEVFLLEMMAAGYSPKEAEGALQEVLTRWQTRFPASAETPKRVLRFVGSHDPVIALLHGRFSELAPDYELSVNFVGSMGGLLALARQGADIAGCHLWDDETNSYNRPYIERMLPGHRVAMVTLAHRRLGLIVPPSNPLDLQDIPDLLHAQFINRQAGTGTRVWLDKRCKALGIDTSKINGYDWEVRTHLQVAGAVAEMQADVGLGVEAAALAYGLDFVRLTTERYDLVITEETWSVPGVQILVEWLQSANAQKAINNVGGYDVTETGRVVWVN